MKAFNIYFHKPANAFPCMNPLGLDLGEYTRFWLK